MVCRYISAFLARDYDAVITILEGMNSLEYIP